MADDDPTDDKKSGSINKIVTSSLPIQSTPEFTIAKTATVISSLTTGTPVSTAPSGITSLQLRQHFISTPLGLRLANNAVAVPVQNVPSQVRRRSFFEYLESFVTNGYGVGPIFI